MLPTMVTTKETLCYILLHEAMKSQKQKLSSLVSQLIMLVSFIYIRYKTISRSFYSCVPNGPGLRWK